MSKASKIQDIQDSLKSDYDICVSEEAAARIYRVLDYDANVRFGAILSIILSFVYQQPVLMIITLIINVSLAAAVISHSNKIRRYEIDSLDNYRIWSKIYLILFIPLLIGVIVVIYLTCVVKDDCYREYEGVVKKIHGDDRNVENDDDGMFDHEEKIDKKIDVDDDDDGDFLL